jgi:protein Tex
MAQNNDDVDFISTQYINKNVVNEEECFKAREIISEWINENSYVRKQLRRLYQRKAIISTKCNQTKKDDEAAQKFNQYFDWSEPFIENTFPPIISNVKSRK